MPLPALSPDTTDFLAEKHLMLIDGKWVPAASGKTIDIVNPATEEVIGTVPAGDAADIDKAVAAARKAFDTGPWPKMPPSERARLLWKLADLLEQNAQQITEVEILDNGMPLNHAGRMAVPLAANMCRYYAGWPTKILGDTIPVDPPMPGVEVLTYTRKEPVGVVGQITPWNYPLGMVAMKLGPALATGCTVVLKPAEQAPLTALIVAELVQEAGIPDGVVNVVTGYGETAGAALTAHPDVDKVAFTGSTDVGRIILRAAAGNLKKVSLELGGKSPFIIFPDADLERAIPGAAFSAFFLQGQNCMCGSRLFVHKQIFDKVVEGVAGFAKMMKIGPGLDPETNIGPLISSEQLSRVSGFLAAGPKEGATLVAGGKRVDRKGYFVEPTVFANTNREMKVVREEIFGPVTCAQMFDTDDLDAVAKLANDTAFGLVGSIWTKNLAIAHKLAARIKAGTMGINTHGMADINAPFGGYKQSGWGREFGKESLDLYLETKTVVQHM
ncbi:MAG: aldehyde dehydrogenase family protein [Alphaproteobacteria bacterium]|nr:aldehyde dehydrogenase family protein [Alphaproteobacteria bacterium]